MDPLSVIDLKPPDEDEHLAGQALLADKKYFAAMRHFARRLRLDPSDARSYEGGASALLASAGDGSVFGEWDSSERQLFYRTLILQEQCNAAPPLLHRVVAQDSSAEATIALSALSAALEPVLRQLREQGELAFFEWLLGEDGRIADRDMAEIIDNRGTRADLMADDSAAARSLAVRHLDSLDGCATASRERYGLDHELEGLLTSVSTARRRLRDELKAPPSSISQRLFHDRYWQRCVALGHLVAQKAPVVRLARRRLKVAICVSGQLRGYRAVFPTWQRSLLRSLDHHIFVHSWTHIGRSGAEPYRYVLPFDGQHFCHEYRAACLQLGFEEFKSRYPSLFLELTRSALVTQEAVASFYQTHQVRLDDDSGPMFCGLSNQQKMHRKIEDCYQLVAQSGQEFDLIIRLRPDKPVDLLGFEWARLNQLCHASPALFADHAMGVQFGTLMMGDQFAVGAPATMAAYSTTWSTYPSLAKSRLFQCGEKFDGHTSLAQVCWAHSIPVEKAPMRFGKLQDSEPLPIHSILQAVSNDANGRMDATDRSLLTAAGRDQGNPAASMQEMRP